MRSSEMGASRGIQECYLMTFNSQPGRVFVYKYMNVCVFTHVRILLLIVFILRLEFSQLGKQTVFF